MSYRLLVKNIMQKAITKLLDHVTIFEMHHVRLLCLIAPQQSL